MKRYFEPTSGELTCSKEALDMYKDPSKRNMTAYPMVNYYLTSKLIIYVPHSHSICKSQGEKLRELLLKHGSFEEVEIEIEKVSKQTEKNKVAGGWHNEVSLKEIHKWTPQLGSIYVFGFHLTYF